MDLGSERTCVPENDLRHASPAAEPEVELDVRDRLDERGEDVQTACSRAWQKVSPVVQRRLQLEDLVQEVASIHLADDAGERSADEKRALSYGTACNVLAMEARSLVRERRALESLAALRALEGPEASLPACVDLEADLAEALQKLPRLDRELLRERHYQGLSLEEMALRRDRSISWVSRRLARACRELQNFFQKVGKS